MPGPTAGKLEEPPLPDDLSLPPGACDCHMHVFADPHAYPPAATRAYTPRRAGLDDWRAMAAPLGLQRVVLVQPSAYGTDNRLMCDTLRANPGLRGVAVIGPETQDGDLRAMHDLGVRAIRLNLVSNGIPDPRAAAIQLANAAARAGRLGWHVQIFVPGPLLAALAPTIASLSVPVVIDHMGGADASLGLDQPGQPELRALLAEGRAWVKVSGINRVSRQASGFRDALPVMRALIAANPARCVWGTDWPHIGAHAAGEASPVIYMGHDNADLLRALFEAAPEAEVRRAILAENPGLLYDF